MSLNPLNTHPDEAGFTLIELLLAITILGILMASVSVAMIVGLRTNESTGARLDESRDQQFVAAYFSADAHGAQTIKTSGAPTCDRAGGGGILVVEFLGQYVSDSDPPTVKDRTVSYVLRAGPAEPTREMHRLVCMDGKATPAAGGDTTLARGLSDSPPIVTPCPAGCTDVTVTLTSGGLTFAVTGHKRTNP